MAQNIDLSLTPADNTRLANLCGVMDENITHIARALSVKIKRCGGRFRVSGAAAEDAAAALRALYSRAEQRNIGSDDVRLQLAQPTAGEGDAAGDAESANAEAFVLHAPPVHRRSASHAEVRNAAQQEYWDKIARHAITLCSGPAGTGKTHIAVAAALQHLRPQAGEPPMRLVLSRPVVEAGGERLGFLPGDMEQKVNPYLRPLYDILHQLLGRQATERRMASGEIEILPLAFMRGITLNHTVLILDEAQNTTPAQMKMLLTRLGEGSKLIINGDTSQADIPVALTSGLADAMARLRKVRGVAMHQFQSSDIVRSPLVREILNAYEDAN